MFNKFRWVVVAVSDEWWNRGLSISIESNGRKLKEWIKEWITNCQVGDADVSTSSTRRKIWTFAPCLSTVGRPRGWMLIRLRWFDMMMADRRMDDGWHKYKKITFYYTFPYVSQEIGDNHNILSLLHRYASSRLDIVKIWKQANDSNHSITHG